MFSNINPLYDKVLIKREEQKEKTESGLYLPQSAEQEKVLFGTVVATGEGKMHNNGQITPLTVKTGDVVMFSKYSGIELDSEYLLLREDELLAKGK